MAIKIVDNGPDITLTPGEYSRLAEEYSRAFSFHCGPKPTFEEWVHNKKLSESRLLIE